MKGSKSEARLARRLRGYDNLGKSTIIGGRKVAASSINSGAFHKPGSNKK